MIDWKKRFDAIYCIHYLPYEDRVERMTEELKRVGILDSDIFHWKYTFDSPFYNNLINSDIKLFHDTLRRPSLLKCTLGHYGVYKEAFGLKFDRILILEDDIVFLKDLELIGKYIDSMPDDSDIVLFDYLPFDKYHFDNYVENRRINDMYSGFDEYFSSGGFYSISRRGMEFVIKRQESSLHAGDTAWHNSNGVYDGINRCFSLKQLGYQKQYENSYTIQSSGHGMLERHYSYTGLQVGDYA